MEEVVIVGGGIAGLATAVALKKVGVRALVLERSTELRATGAALSLFPNAWVALDALGVSDKVAALYAPSDKGYVTNVQTKSIQEVRYASNDWNGAPPRTIHWKVLLEALAEELPPNTIRFSSKITSIETQVEQRSPICMVTLDDGTVIKSKAVIGCDGLHSILARWLGLRPPVYAGRSAARGLSLFPEGHGLEHGAVQQFVDVRKRAGFIALNDKEVYWFCVVMGSPKEKLDPEMIQREVSENLAKDFPPVFINVVKHSDLSSVTWAPLMFRYPWDVLFGNLARSNVTVAGDAMHPMTPDLGQGGCSALEDAVVLGRHLGDLISKHGELVARDIGFAIEKYVKERRLRATALIAASYFSGWLQHDGSSRLMRFLSYQKQTKMISTNSVALLFIVLILFLVHIMKLKFRSIHKNGKLEPQLPPGPAPWPIVGCAPEMLRQKPTFRWIHRLMKEMDTDIACIRLGNVHVIPVTCPEIARELLKNHDATFSSRPPSMATRTSSGGYLTTSLTPYGTQWKKMRRVLVSEIISPARHHWLKDRRTEEADNLVKYIYNRRKSSSRTVNVRTATRQYTGNVIRKLMFGKRCFGEERADGGPTMAEEEHIEAVFTILKYVYAFCISDYFPCLVGLDLDGHEKFVKEAIRTVNNYHDPIIDSRIGKWRRFVDSDDESTSDEPRDLLDVLVTLKDAEGKPLLTPEEIKAQVIELMFATVDNPSNAVEWAMAEMINQPEILKTAMDELDRVVGRERLVQECDIPQLNYIKACIREAFRLHPIAPFNPPHVAMSDAVVAGYFIPKGSHVLLSRLGLGRNPKVWNKALEFRPERHFTSGCTEVQLTEPDLRFISFSTGRRGCVAPVLGTAMTVMLLARMVQGFHWKAPPNVTSINLDQSFEDMFLANPLVAHAEPRLPLRLYP